MAKGQRSGLKLPFIFKFPFIFSLLACTSYLLYSRGKRPHQRSTPPTSGIPKSEHFEALDRYFETPVSVLPPCHHVMLFALLSQLTSFP